MSLPQEGKVIDPHPPGQDPPNQPFLKTPRDLNAGLSFCECRFSGKGYHQVMGHSNLNICKRICLNFLYSHVAGMQKILAKSACTWTRVLQSELSSQYGVCVLGCLIIFVYLLSCGQSMTPKKFKIRLKTKSYNRDC